jgi:AAA+ superfamily predicted ATPase
MHPLVDELKLMFSSGYPLIYLLTHEEDRAQRLLAEALQSTDLKLDVWSRTLVPKGSAKDVSLVSFLKSLRTAQPGVSVLLDSNEYLKDAEVVRHIRDLLPVLSKMPHPLVFISPVLVLPPELEKEISVLEVPLPSQAELNVLFGRVCVDEQAIFPEEFVDKVTRVARGLTENEARRAFAKALHKGGGFQLDDVGLIIEEKKAAIRKSEALEFFDLEDDLGKVGGMDEVKRWLKNRNIAFGEEAARYGLPVPKGLLLIGVQGCGKSLTAKAVAGSWHLPLIRLDLAAVFGSLSPETTMRRAVVVAESLAPVVLWVDEIEKGFSDSGSAASHSFRVFGSFITWLQEKKAPVFVVATANEVEALPPELLRKGRFDEMFFVDLPNVHERQAILAIHLKKRNRNPQSFDLEALSRQTEHFSGAELEQGVVAGLYRAFSEKRELITRDIELELDEIVPLYATVEEKVKKLREWAKKRTRKASVDPSLVDLFEEA